MKNLLNRFLDERAATTAEYAIMVASVPLLGVSVAGLFETVVGTF